MEGERRLGFIRTLVPHAHRTVVRSRTPRHICVYSRYLWGYRFRCVTCTRLDVGLLYTFPTFTYILRFPHCVAFCLFTHFRYAHILPHVAVDHVHHTSVLFTDSSTVSFFVPAYLLRFALRFVYPAVLRLSFLCVTFLHFTLSAHIVYYTLHTTFVHALFCRSSHTLHFTFCCYLLVVGFVTFRCHTLDLLLRTHTRFIRWLISFLFTPLHRIYILFYLHLFPTFIYSLPPNLSSLTICIYLFAHSLGSTPSVEHSFAFIIPIPLGGGWVDHSLFIWFGWRLVHCPFTFPTFIIRSWWGGWCFRYYVVYLLPFTFIAHIYSPHSVGWYLFICPRWLHCCYLSPHIPLHVPHALSFTFVAFYLWPPTLLNLFIAMHSRCSSPCLHLHYILFIIWWVIPLTIPHPHSCYPLFLLSFPCCCWWVGGWGHLYFAFLVFLPLLALLVVLLWWVVVFVVIQYDLHTHLHFTFPSLSPLYSTFYCWYSLLYSHLFTLLLFVVFILLLLCVYIPHLHSLHCTLPIPPCYVAIHLSGAVGRWWWPGDLWWPEPFIIDSGDQIIPIPRRGLVTPPRRDVTLYPLPAHYPIPLSYPIYWYCPFPKTLGDSDSDPVSDVI